MHVQFLIGPVKLRTCSQHARVFEIAKSGLHARLSAIGFDDLGGRPFAPVGDQDAQTEIVLEEPPIFFQITPTAHLDGSLLVAPDLAVDYCAQILATADLSQLPSYRFRCTARCRSEEHTSELQSLRHLVCRLL